MGMNLGAPLSFATTVSDAQRQLQDALRAGMGAKQQPMPTAPRPQMPQPQQAMQPQMPQPQQAMQPQMPQPMPQMAPQGMPQAMQSQMGSAMGSPQMGAPQRFARGGLAVKKAEGGGAWTRKEGKNPEGGLNAKGRASLRAQGHDIKPPVSAKQAKKSPKSAARRKSFCARMGGMEGPMKDEKGRPTRKALALRKWDC
jgi:hypothetical protein